jgi:hypothetical protein
VTRLRPFFGICLFALTATLQSATLTSSVAVSCDLRPFGFSTTNPCSLSGLVPDAIGRPVPGYAESAASTSVDYGLITTSVRTRAENGVATASVIGRYSDRLNIIGTGIGSLQLDMFLPGFGCVTICGETVLNTIGVGANTQTPLLLNSENRTLTFPILFGQNFDFFGQLQVRVSDGTEENGVNGSYIFRVNGIRVFDASGAQLQNFYYATESGRSYPVQSGQLVPEPGPVWLMLAGLTTLLGIRRFSAQSPQSR